MVREYSIAIASCRVVRKSRSNSRAAASRQARMDEAETFVISRLLPQDGPDLQYRVTSSSGRERVVAEDEIATTAAQSDSTATTDDAR